jgi:hypothetical protein
MAKRKSIKQEIALLKRKVTRETRKKMFDEVCVKGRVETLWDVSCIFFGLSHKAVENAACREIMYHARRGCTVKEILELMEVRNENKNRL